MSKMAFGLFILPMIMVVFMMPGISSAGYVKGIGYANAECAPGYQGVLSGDKYCGWKGSTTGEERSVVLYGAGQQWLPGSMGQYLYGFENAYVPMSGEWRLYINFCPSSTQQKCTLAKSSARLKAAYDVNFLSNKLIVDQKPDFGGFNGYIGFSANACYTFVDWSGVAWKSEGEFMCADAHVLPETPSNCYINYGEDLTVNMGTLERGKIATTPGTSSPTVKKTIPVLCTRDAETTLETRFEYSQLSVNGNNVIQSSSNGLGIAIHYGSKVVSPSDRFTASYALGYTYIDLEFEAVRDPAVAVRDIPTGSFTASATMIMTQK